MFACDDYKYKSSFLAAGELSASESLEVRKHLAECPSCRADLGISRKLFRLLDTVEEVEPPSLLGAWVMTSLEQEGRSRLTSLSASLFRIMAVVSGLISLPLLLWYLKSVVSSLSYGHRISFPWQDSFLIRLFIAVARSAASLFNDSFIASPFRLSEMMPHFPAAFSVLLGIILTASLLFSLLFSLLLKRKTIF